MRSSNRRKKKKSNNRINISINTSKIVILITVILLILLLSTIFALTKSFGEKMISGIYINGIEVSNLTINEAYDKLKEELQKNIQNNIIVQKEEYETTISLEQLEVNYNIIEAINEAYKIGRNKNIIISNYQIIKAKLFHEKIEKDIEFNEEQLNLIIEDISAKIPNLVVESSYYIEENNLIISNGKAGIKVNEEQLKSKIKEAIKKQVQGEKIETIQIPTYQKQPDEIDIEKIKQEICKEPQNASYQDNQIYREVEGIDFKISIEEIEKLLEQEKEEYIIPLTIKEPEITIEDLAEENIFPEQLSKYITRYDESNINRSINIKLASEKINGTILMPGETFSYNKVVGERTIKAGYKEASVYMNGKVVDGIGGGICQVSSTLYNAVLEANLEIVSRKNHYFITSYVSASRDATVAYGTIDFQFKNTRSYPIKIECISQNGICQIKVYGIKEDIEYEVVIEDTITEVIPYTTKYIETNQLENGVENEIQKGVDGYKSEAYRILKINGQIISKTLLSKDSYNPLQRIVEKGTK